MRAQLKVTGLLLAGSALFFAAPNACTSSGGGDPDAGTTTKDAGTTVDAGTDAGFVDAGDGKCHGDEGCKLNEYCDVATGACIVSKPCKKLDDCDYQGSTEDYCAYGGCFCDTERNGGTCRPRFKPCSTCTRDVECGDDGFVYTDFVAKCADYQGVKVCLPQRPLCPAGYRIESSDSKNCVPGGGSCSAAGVCTKDADCDPTSARPVCDIGRGFCIESCVFEFQTGDSPTCPPGQRCHVDGRLLSANNPNFGGGKCGKACDGDAPFVCSEKTACEEDGDTLISGARPKRCRPPKPKCVRDADCPSDAAAHSRGYCDPATLDCKVGCRREGDCDSGFRCLQNQCVQKTCIENGGANISCARGEFCCGEDNSHEPCAAGVSVGQCYPAPKPPWCEVCANPGDPVPTPGGPRRPQTSVCDDKKFWKHSCDPLKPAMCPRGRNCEASELKACEQDTDCGPTGLCAERTIGDQTGKICVCDNAAPCPGALVCKASISGIANACVGYWCNNADCSPPP